MYCLTVSAAHAAQERGVVWEESIVLAPKSARFAFLSATIPNAREFAQWVAKVSSLPEAGAVAM